MQSNEPSMRWSLAELSGSLGDMGTFLPLVLAMSLACELDLGVVLVMAGLMNIATGFAFNQPMPVQPMKAIAAVAIAEGLTAGDIAAGGLWMGGALVILAVTGGVDWVARWTPKALVRGIQLGIGAKLILEAWKWLFVKEGGLPVVGWDGLIVAAIAAVALALPFARRIPILLILFLGGFGLLYLVNHSAYWGVGITAPAWEFVWPKGEQWASGAWRVALPQLPLTVLNSVIAVCALSADYFPGRGIGHRKMALSVGLMNLVSVPLGGIPMCHGAGGLAAQHRFGARTGGSVVMLGAAKVAIGLAFGGTITALLHGYPRSILAVMVAFAGVTLASVARDSLRGRALVVVVVTAAGIVAYNAAIGFVAGAAVAGLLRVIFGKEDQRDLDRKT